MAVNVPYFNFPYQYSASGKHREVFSNYGSSVIINVCEDGEIVSPKNRGEDYVRYSAVHPVLPLSSRAVKVKLPLKDRVMGRIIEANKNLKSFALKVQQFYTHARRFGKYDQVEDVLSDVGEFKRNSYSFDQLDGIVDSQKPWFKAMLEDYSSLQGVPGPQFHNYRYAGGCLVSSSLDDTHCYVLSPAGLRFNKLQGLKFVLQQREGLLESYNGEEVTLDGTIYGIRNQQVQGQDYAAVRTASKCYLYQVHRDSTEKKLQQVSAPQSLYCSAVDISPYIPGECVMIEETGKCILWSGDSTSDVPIQCEPRFSVFDNWRHIQYGSHPRQLIYADQTNVQLLDLRMSTIEGQDLFALPSKLLHNKERIRACSRHPGSDFLNIVATDYSLMLLDERYTKYPVLNWEHMMSTPPQYMSCLSGSHDNRDDNFIYVASQYPADVHAFRFSLSKECPPISISQAHKVAKITDITKWPSFVDKCPNTALLHDRLNTSLAGISVLPWQQGHVVFQLDSHGEIFHQVFSADQYAADVTFSAGLGSHDLKVLPVAVERAQVWIDSWVGMMKQLLAPEIRTREVHASLLGLYYYRSPDERCYVCNPNLGYMPGEAESPNETAYCSTCMVLLKDGQNLVQSVQKDSLMASTSDSRPRHLKSLEKITVNTALSKILMKQWQCGGEGEGLEEILNDWDKEVLLKRSSKKQSRQNDVNDMSEESVTRRILNYAAGSKSPARKTTSTVNQSRAPRQGSSTEENVDTGNQRQKQNKNRSNTESPRKSDSVSSSRKRPKTSRAKSPGASCDDQSSIPVSVETGSADSIVFGSMNSSISDTFKVKNQENNQVGMPRFTSFLTQSRGQSNSQQKKLPEKTTNNDTVFVAPNPVKKSKGMSSKASKASESPEKDTRKKHKKKRTSAESVRSVSTVSEISVNPGSEDLFDDSHTLEIASVDDDRSTVLSVANCNIISNKQLSNNVSRTNQSMIDKHIVSSPKKPSVNFSPRKAVKRKLVAGF